MLKLTTNFMNSVFEKMEMNWAYPTQRADQHHPPSLGLEPSGEAEKRKTSPNMEKNSASRAKDHQHDLQGGKEDSSRSRKMEAHSQSPIVPE